MKSRQRRVRTIELSLTPQQIAQVWLRETRAGHSFEEAAQHQPPHRGLLANKVLHAVQRAMKGQPEQTVERAVNQARREADLLYMLAVNVNSNVLQAWNQREREYLLLLGHMSAELRAAQTKKSMEVLRTTFLIFIKAVLILETAVKEVAAERFFGESVLFRDTEPELSEQMRHATDLSNRFNELAADVESVPIDLDRLREDLRPEANRQTVNWLRVARLECLTLFGTAGEVAAEVQATFRFFRSNELRNDGDSLRSNIGSAEPSATFV